MEMMLWADRNRQASHMGRVFMKIPYSSMLFFALRFNLLCSLFFLELIGHCDFVSCMTISASEAIFTILKQNTQVWLVGVFFVNLIHQFQ